LRNGVLLSLHLTSELLLLTACALMNYSTAELKRFNLMYFTLQLNFVKRQDNYNDASNGG